MLSVNIRTYVRTYAPNSPIASPSVCEMVVRLFVGLSVGQSRAEQPSKRIVVQEIPVLSRVGNVVASERAAVLRPACVTYPQSAEIGTSQAKSGVRFFFFMLKGGSSIITYHPT